MIKRVEPNRKTVYDVPIDVLGKVWIVARGIIKVNAGTIIHDVENAAEHVVLDDNAVYVPLENAIYMTDMAHERLKQIGD